MSSTFAKLVEDFHAHKISDVTSRILCGLTNDLGHLPDPSKAASEKTVSNAKALLERFEAIEAMSLDFETALDRELAILMLKAEIHDHSYTFNGRTQRAQLPSAGDEIGDGMFLIFINDPRPAQPRIEDIHAQLSEVPDFCRAMLSRLDTPLARWVAMDVEKVGGLPELFATLANWAKEEGYVDIEGFEKARSAAEVALREYADDLAKLPTTTQLHVGDEVARKIVEYRGIDKSFTALHQIASDFLARTRDQIEALRHSLVQKYDLPETTSSEELQKFLAETYRVELPNGKIEDILDLYQEERESILSFITERNLFPILDDQEMMILRTPSFMAPSIPAGAMMPPAAFREGTRTSLVYLTLSEELIDEHTRLSIPSMMIHEGIPGHHLQLATASTHPSTVRRHVNANDHAEGWTTMLEDYMLDVGYKSELADEVRFCGKRDLSRIGARVAIDLFFMTGNKSYLDVGVECDLSSDDPFEAAGSLLQAVTGFVPSRVQAELNWYSQARGYPLSYLTGNHMVWEIKEQISSQNQDEPLDLDRRFHELYLHSGRMPLEFFRRVLVNEGLLPQDCE